MRHIEDLRDCHKGKEIWVIGCGPSLDDFPDDFFDNRLSIALNWMFIAFPRCTYIHYDHILLKDFMEEKPDLFKKCILTWPVEARILPDDFGEHKEDPIWMDRGRTPTIKETVEEAVRKIMEGCAGSYVTGINVCHAAIQAAAILGASEITLVGCEYIFTGLRGAHAQKRGLSDFYKKEEELLDWRREEFAHIEKGITPDVVGWLARAFKPYKREVRRYYYGKGYEEIT